MEPDRYAIAKMQEIIAKAEAGKDPGRIPEGHNENNEIKGGSPEQKEDDNMELNVAKMTPVEKAVYEDLKKRYGTEGTAEPKPAAGTEEVPEGAREVMTKAMKEAMEGVAKSMAKQMEAVFAPVMKKAEEAKEAQLLEVAKKYEVLGTKPEQLVPVLKSMKETSAETYDAFIATMDANVEAVEKSGLFSEIGKPGHAGGASGLTSDRAWDTIEKKASAMMEKEPTLTHAQAVDRVCMANPALVHAYEKQ